MAMAGMYFLLNSALPAAAVALETGRPAGTGMPAAINNIRVRSLSWAMDSATRLVWQVSAA